MKKLITAAILWTALAVQPASGIDSYRPAVAELGDTAAGAYAEYVEDAASAAAKVTRADLAVVFSQYAEEIKRVLLELPAMDAVPPASANTRDRILPRASESDIVTSSYTSGTRRSTAQTEEIPEPTHWIVFPLALITMGLIVRRRISVR